MSYRYRDLISYRYLIEVKPLTSTYHYRSGLKQHPGHTVQLAASRDA